MEGKANRDNVLDELSQKIYKDLDFSEDEKKASERFQKLIESAKAAIKEDFYFLLAMRYKKEIEDTELFKKVKEMPKGALLHHHLVSEIDIEWLVKKTYDPNIFQRHFERPSIASSDGLVYSKKPRSADQNVLKLRDASGNPEEFDKMLRNKITLLPQDFDGALNNKEMWQKVFYLKYFYGIQLVSYREFFREHLKLLCKKYIAEGVYRVETRYYPGQLLDENEESVSIDEEIKIFREVIQEIKKECPNFSFGIISEVYRFLSPEEITKRMHAAYLFKSKAPELLLALDFDGDEDGLKKFKDLSSIIETNQKECEEKYHCKLPLILHCGESILYSNQNIIDALLLNTKRIGHGINIIKYPHLWDEIKKRDICIEINPISNQTLKLVRDLRMHPAITYHNYSIPIVISGDDPTSYSTSGVSYDLFAAVLAFEWTLKDLKVICLNSIRYSVAETEEKIKLEKFFLHEAWQSFIDNLLKN